MIDNGRQRVISPYLSRLNGITRSTPASQRVLRAAAAFVRGVGHMNLFVGVFISVQCLASKCKGKGKR